MISSGPPLNKRVTNLCSVVCCQMCCRIMLIILSNSCNCSTEEARSSFCSQTLQARQMTKLWKSYKWVAHNSRQKQIRRVTVWENDNFSLSKRQGQTQLQTNFLSFSFYCLQPFASSVECVNKSELALSDVLLQPYRCVIIVDFSSSKEQKVCDWIIWKHK